jgi:hypothetical protein
MNDRRFDSLARSLGAAATTRRGVIRGVAGGVTASALGVMLGGAVSVIPWSRSDTAEAHNNWSRCRNIEDKKKRKKCKKKGKAHKQWHTTNACRGDGQRCGDRPCCAGLTCIEEFCRAANA